MEIALSIPEMVGEIISRIDDPKAFLSALRVCKEWYHLGKEFIAQKKIEFLRKRRYRDCDGFDHYPLVWPNGSYHGKEEIYDGDILRATREWEDGRLNGWSYYYDNDGTIIKQIPWVEGKRHGRQESKKENGYIAYKYWQDGRPTTKEVYDALVTLKARNEYSSPRTFVHYEADSFGQLQRQGVYVNKEKHGLYLENGSKCLYIHGVKQPWYTGDVRGILLTVAVIGFFAVIIFKAIRDRSLGILARTSDFLIVFGILIVIPFLRALLRGGKTIFRSDT